MIGPISDRDPEDSHSPLMSPLVWDLGHIAGSWATSARVAPPTFGNWDFPQRRQIFAGVRLASDDC